MSASVIGNETWVSAQKSHLSSSNCTHQACISFLTQAGSEQTVALKIVADIHDMRTLIRKIERYKRRIYR